MSQAASRQDAPLGPPGYPLIGHVPAFLRDRLGFLSNCAANYGDVVKLKIGEPTFLLNDPSDIRHVLFTGASNYDKTPRLTSARGNRLSGKGVLTSSGAVHLRQRKMMLPAFYRKTIEGFGDVIVRNTRELVGRWESGSELKIAQTMMALTLQNIIHTVLGPDFEHSDELAGDITIRKRYMEHVFFSFIPEWVPTLLGFAYRAALARINRTLEEAIQQRRRVPVSSHDMLSLLIAATYDDGSVMSDEQVLDEARMTLITGHETIGEGLGWTLHLLAEHQDVEAKLFAEISDVCNGSLPTVEHLPKLPYTAMVLAEAMRLYPPTWIIVRIAREDDTLPSGARISAGSKIYLCQYVTHRDARYWPEPDRFDPERFGETAKKDRPPLAYFPFGAGARLCLGESFAKMEGALVLATIAQSFAFQPVTGGRIELEPRMTLRSKRDIRLRVRRRPQAF
jgi:cytochrome P450